MIAASPRARKMRRYFTGSGATIYTWTSDRHAQYGTRIIPTTVREATQRSRPGRGRASYAWKR